MTREGSWLVLAASRRSVSAFVQAASIEHLASAVCDFAIRNKFTSNNFDIELARFKICPGPVRGADNFPLRLVSDRHANQGLVSTPQFHFRSGVALRKRWSE